MTSPSKKKVKQVGSLSSAVIGSVAIGFVSSVVTTRILEPEAYGDMKFIQNFFQFLAIVFAIGVFPSGALLLTKMGADDKGKKEMIGALLFITAILSLITIAVTAGFSFFENSIFGNDLGKMLLITSPLAAIFLFQPCLEYILQGDNQIYKLSVFRILPGLLYIFSMVGLNFILDVSLTYALMIQIFTGAAVTLVIAYLLRPKYSNFSHNKALIFESDRVYGRHIYTGSLSSVATSYLATFMISYFLDNTQVGFFSLAVTLSLPLMQIPKAVGTTYFKDFANIDFLPKKVTLVSVGVTGLILLIFIAVIKPLVLLVYTEKFSDVVALSYLTAFGSASFGVGDYLNRFLGAHGKGKELRNGAFIVGAVNVVGYYAFVNLFGVIGAAVTQFLAGAVYLLTMMNYYRRYRNERMKTDQQIA